MSRKVWIFVAVVALAVIVPEVVYAATGTFTSASSVTALTASNTDGGRALSATANTGYAGVLTRTATSGTVPALQSSSYSRTTGATSIYGYELGSTGKTYGVWGRAASSTDGTAGVYGLATASSGKTNGLSGQSNSTFGSGVLGFAPSGAGVQGDGGIFGILGFGPFAVAGIGSAIGNGTYGVISSTDTGVGGHLMGAGADLAGTCTVAASATVSPTCPFPNPFPNTSVLVVVTPTSNPGAFYYTTLVTSTGTATGFTITMSAAPSSPVIFDYIAVGLDSTIAASVAKAAHVAGVPR